MYTIIMSSAATTKIFSTANCESEAIDLCHSLNWEWMDENGFVWSLDYYKN